MSGHLTSSQLEEGAAPSSAELSAAITATDFRRHSATVVGYGKMGTQYVNALRALGVGRICVSSRSEGPLAALQGQAGIETVAGGVERLERRPLPDELAIVATPTLSLVSVTERLVALGYRRLLIEKPVSLWSPQIERLADAVERDGVEAMCAYNRVAYPSLVEARQRAQEEGGITSCTYTFTEFIQRLNLSRYPEEELARWGIANSLHVVSMAHALIGMPSTWHGHRSGSLSWHPAGAVFVGSGLSEHGIPFAYHADWGSTGRWSVELHTSASSYRLCPLEQLFRRTTPTAEWEPVPVSAFAPEVKVGFVEQVAAMLHIELRGRLPLVSLRETASLTKFGEEIFGYTG